MESLVSSAVAYPKKILSIVKTTKLTVETYLCFTKERPKATNVSSHNPSIKITKSPNPKSILTSCISKGEIIKTLYNVSRVP
jgi:hypothetical protein